MILKLLRLVTLVFVCLSLIAFQPLVKWRFLLKGHHLQSWVNSQQNDCGWVKGGVFAISKQNQDNPLLGRPCPEGCGVHPHHSFTAKPYSLVAQHSAAGSTHCAPALWGFPWLSLSVSCQHYLGVQDSGWSSVSLFPSPFLMPYALDLHLQLDNSRQISLVRMQWWMAMHFDTWDKSFHCWLTSIHVRF